MDVSLLVQRIEQRQLRVGVIGLGYVGLPLAIGFASAGFTVCGFDVDAKRVDALNGGHCHVPDVDAAQFADALAQGRFRATTDFGALADIDAISICVPTPLNKTKDPDISFIISAVNHVAETLRAGQIVVLESTTYPGTTEELVLPTLQANGLQVGVDFFLAFSPERVDPGNVTYHLSNTPKVLGGITAACAQAATALYEAVVDHVITVSSTQAAEMVKLLENMYRAVNIGLVNEFAQMCAILGVDVWEVITAAATKPYGFMPFYPGPGLGGHCIPVDPHYLAWKLRTLSYRARFIELASEVNGEMPRYVVQQVIHALNEAGKCLNGSTIFVLGVAYKPNTNDVRESPVLDIIELLRQGHAHVEFIDPHVRAITLGNISLEASSYSDAAIENADCVVIATNHSAFDYQHLAEHARLIVDTRNAMKDVSGNAALWRLGARNQAAPPLPMRVSSHS